MSIRKVLIYRLGSLGDTVVALPCLHLIARAFPDAERHVLTNFPASGKEAPLESVIGDSGLVHGYFRYPLGSRNLKDLWGLTRSIRKWSPDVLIYLADPRGRIKVYRDAMFFLICGIRRLIGFPYTADLREHKKLNEEPIFESEAHRLARCINVIGNIDLDDYKSWDLCLNEAEEQSASDILQAGMPVFIAVGAGTKMDIKDWGKINWETLLSSISSYYPKLGLVLLGSADERELNGFIAAKWSGEIRNLCGLVSPRVSAAVLKRAELFVGHDSGPMHIAAAVGTHCVAVFSGRNKPGKWYPHGSEHRVIFHHTECVDCGLTKCNKYNKACLTSISVKEVLDVVIRKLEDKQVGNNDRIGTRINE